MIQPLQVKWLYCIHFISTLIPYAVQSVISKRSLAIFDTTSSGFRQILDAVLIIRCKQRPSSTTTLNHH